ncbi:MAG: DUF4469 domain-containing protein [Bacteroidales bacterium]|jgi:hypothetical protein|nr:DUF4469 domain-containing protein [Bacteroidales bacterium]
MAEEKSNVTVELYDLVLTDRKDDRFGRVVIVRHDKVEDLIRIAVSRRTDLNAATLRASYDILKAVAMEEVTNGASVEFGLGHHTLTANGTFIGDHAKWDGEKNSLSLRTAPLAEVYQLLKNVKVTVRGMAATGIVINTLTDVSTGEVNARLTPGGGVNIVGSKIRIAGDAPGNGVLLINQHTGETVEVPKNAFLTNDPSKISFIVPAHLPVGDYKLSLTTQFSTNANLLKEPRTYLFEYVLVCA